MKKGNKKKNKKTAVALALVFCFIAGVISGGFISERIFVKNKTVQTVADTDGKAHTEAEIKESEEVHEQTELSEEEKMLEALNAQLVSFMKEKYPDSELSFLIENLDSGAKTVYNNKKMNCASIIKLFIAEHIYKGIEAGKYEHTSKVQDDLYHLIVESNNPAANRFIDMAGGDNEKRKIDDTNEIRVTIKERNYTDTELNRKMYDEIPPGGPTGYQNYSSVEDISRLLKDLYKGKLLSEAYTQEFLTFMKLQERTGKIPSLIKLEHPEFKIANKTGEMAQVESDAALILSDDLKLVFIVMTDNIPLDDDGSPDENLKFQVQKDIAKMGLMVVEKYKNNKE